eukprot:s321_g38.t1
MPGWDLENLTYDSQGLGIISQSQGGGQSHGVAMYFRDVFKAVGLNLFANLQQVTTGFKRIPYSQLCNEFRHTDPLRRTAFAFVRDPISRFMSGYEELEFRSRSGLSWPTYNFLAKLLKGHSVGSPERAVAFLEEFIRSGINTNGHVRPQTELLLPAHACSMPMNVIGKVEQLEEDWARIFQLQNQTAPPFDNSLAVDFHEPRDRLAMKMAFGLAMADGSETRAAFSRNLTRNGARYLRALCWLFLADYGVFDYELPDECQQEPMRSAIALVREESVKVSA